MGEKQVVLGLVETWRVRAQKSIAEIDAALTSGDFGTVREAAHALKGSSLNLAINRLGQAAGELQDAATAADGQAARRLAATVREAYDELTEALPRILPSAAAR